MPVSVTTNPMVPEPSFFNSGGRTVFRLTGDDRVRYLNGQITQDVASLEPNVFKEALVLNHKGKIEAALHFGEMGSESALLVESDPGLRESLFARLGRYIIADDVELEDVSDDWGLFHFWGTPLSRVRDLLEERPGEVFANARFGLAGVDVFLPAGESASWRKQLIAGGLAEADQETAEIHRIAHGRPRWGRETTSDRLPAELRVENRAISFSKGCYVGQEVVSRMKMSGKVNWLLCQIEFPPDFMGIEKLPLDLVAAEAPDSVVGQWTSAAPPASLKPSESRVGLALIKKAFSDPGVRLSIGKVSEGDDVTMKGDLLIREFPSIDTEPVS